tara:strand:+ start:29032 stop:29526 length:495 start_codon:yes stop_codon:yes gene_type:complete
MKNLIIFGALILGALIFTKKAISGVNDDYDELFVKFGLKHGVNPKILKAISLNESWLGEYQNSVTVGGNTTAGLMHIELPTARDYMPMIDRDELLKPEVEIEVAAMLVKDLMKKYNNNLELVLRAYNGGQGRVTQYLNGTVNETWKKNTTAYWERFNRNMERLG